MQPSQPRPVRTSRPVGALFWAAVLFVGAFIQARLSTTEAPRLNLAPWLDLAPASGSLALVWTAALSGAGSWVLPAIFGLLVATVFLWIEQALRDAFETPHVEAAAAATAVILVASASTGFFRLADGAVPLVASAASMLLLLTIVGLSRGRGPMVGLLVVGVGAALVVRTGDALPLLGAERLIGGLRSGLADFLAAPVMALGTNPRFEVPTGLALVSGRHAMLAGLAIHGLVLGAGMMIAGIRRGLFAMLVGAAISVATATARGPTYVPGHGAWLLCSLMPYLPLAGISMSVLRGRTPRAIFTGIALGAAVIGAVVAQDRADWMKAMRSALHVASVTGQDGMPVRIDPDREVDVARLVLYATNSPPGEIFVTEALVRARDLLQANAPAFRGDVLARIVAESLDPNHDAITRSPGYRALIERLSRELSHVQALADSGLREHFDEMAEALVAVTPDAVEAHAMAPRALETLRQLDAFNRLATLVITPAARMGDYARSIPLREGLAAIGGANPVTDALLALARIQNGEFEQGKRELEPLIARLDRKEKLAAVLRGFLGIARERLGDAPGALSDYQAAWSVMGVGGAKQVEETWHVDSLDYYLVAEILMHRYDVARNLDSGLVPQAARDLSELLDSPLKYGVRRLPAVAMMGRLALLEGRRDEGLALLREARALRIETMDDRSDGPRGRIGHRRYRELALKTLRDALDPTKDAEERAAVEHDLSLLGSG